MSPNRLRINKHDERAAKGPKSQAHDHARSKPPILGAGNSAISNLMNDASSGKELEPGMRAAMEAAFGSDFSNVRIHDDEQARAHATAMNANAFTHGEEIFIGTGPTSPQLIAHELAHVVQQRQAAEIKNEVNRPGDHFERAADQMAQQVLSGGKATASQGGTAPAIQRSPRDEQVYEEVVAALEAYLRRALQAQGGRSLRVTDEVRTAVRTLFMGDAGGMLKIDAWLDGKTTIADPAAFAREVASRLPANFDRARLQNLNRMVAGPDQPGSVLGRLGEAWTRSAAGGPESEEEKESEAVARGSQKGPTTRISARETRAPGVPTAEQRAQQLEQIGHVVRGEEQPFKIGPVPIDVTRIVRVLGQGRDILHGPRTSKPAAPEPRTNPNLESVLKKLDPKSLIPASARNKSNEGNFAESDEFARSLAAQLDVALQQGLESIRIDMEAYKGVKDVAVIQEINRIIQLIRETFPDQARKVQFIDVFFGEKWVTRGKANSE